MTGSVLGIGNAIVDVLTHTDDAFLESHGMAKGSMTLIDGDRAEELYAKIDAGVECSGGSAANSMVGIASLGGEARYIGKVRDDALGALFARDIREAGVAFDTAAATDGPPTARCLVYVTSDAQRTMQTLLGASATLGPDDIDEQAVRGAAITFLEGYLWDPEPAKRAFLRAAEIAHGAGGKVALTLSDPFCVERHRESFRDLAENHVDILFANEAEIISLYQASTLEEAIDCLKGKCEIAAITLGERGSLVVKGGHATGFCAEPDTEVVDTTGAGDLFAAGFLYGLSTGRPFPDCARIGGIAAAEIISHFGARPEQPLSELVRSKLG